MSAEQSVLDYLNGDVDLTRLGVSAHAQVPEDRPDAFITVERTGGMSDRFLDRATLAVQVWAPTRARTLALTEDVRRKLWDIWRRPEVASIDIPSMYHFPDPDSQQERYQLVVTLRCSP